SVLLVQFAVLGGLGWVSGVVLGSVAAPGGVVSRAVSELFPDAANVTSWLAMVAGIGTFAMLRKAPDGLAAANARSLRRFVPPSAMTHAHGLEATETSGPMRRPATLEVRDVTVTFGMVQAVSGVSLRVLPGEVVGLIGPNGAGKTTLLDLITGFTRAHSGEV